MTKRKKYYEAARERLQALWDKTNKTPRRIEKCAITFLGTRHKEWIAVRVGHENMYVMLGTTYSIARAEIIRRGKEK